MIDPQLLGDDGTAIPLDFSRWLEPPSPGELRVLERAVSPVLDIGCGPGRHVLALARAGIVALGVDAAPSAVALATDRGAPVLLRSVFERVPGVGRWGCALLLDGNIGIGGDPAALLARVGHLLRYGGSVLVEVDPPGRISGRFRARVGSSAGVSASFPWARVAAGDLDRLSAAAGLRLDELWTDEGRWFARLKRA